jgi:hypothetical protein
MRRVIHILVTLFTILPIAAYAIYAFVGTIAWHDLPGTLLTLSLDQLHYLLVVVISMMLLQELANSGTTKRIVEQLINPFEASHRGNSVLVNIGWWGTVSVLSVVGVIIPFLDLLGSIPGSVNNMSELAPKIALVLLSGSYIYHVIDRPIAQKENIKAALAKTGAMSVLTRAEDHDYMSHALDQASKGDTFYVTSFEEARNPMKPEGFYYEGEFMQEWYRTAKQKELRIFQIVLINSIQDIADLERRIDLTKDIPTYQLACLVAPRLTVFVDFMVVPNRFALFGFSDNPASRNMDEFSLLLTGPAVRRFELMFSNVLFAEAEHVKTFEGVNQHSLDKVKETANLIGRSPSRILKEMFNF